MLVPVFSATALLAVPGGCTRLSLSAMLSLGEESLSSSRDVLVFSIRVSSSSFDNDSRPIILYDGICKLCNGGVKNIRDEALQSEAGKILLVRSGMAPDDISSIVLVEKDRSSIKSETVLRIMQYIQLPFPRLPFFLQLMPLFRRDCVYDNTADNCMEFLDAM